MNITKRVFLYLTRQKGKTISLFLLVFIVAVFLLSSVRVLHASQQLGREIRTSLGAAFYIRASAEVSLNENGETQVKENKLHISQNVIDQITKTGEIQYCNPLNYGFAKSGALQFIPGDQHTEENSMGKVTALRFSALAPDFVEKRAVLTKGKPITDMDSRKILISEPLAERSRIAVGDCLTLTHARLGGSDGAYIDEIPVKTAYVQVEVWGIYRCSTKDSSIKPTAGMPENTIYASLDVLEGLEESEAGIYTGEVDFYLTDPARLNQITRQVQQMQSIDWSTHFIRTNDFQYARIASQSASLAGLVKMLLILVSLVGAAVLTLLLTLRMRGRIREAGILLSVGLTKGQILAAFLLEVLVVAGIAWIFSYPASAGVTELLGNHLFHELPSQLLNKDTLATGSGPLPPAAYLRPDGLQAAQLYLCQLLVVTGSTLASSLVIVRLKPRELLAK